MCVCFSAFFTRFLIKKLENYCHVLTGFSSSSTLLFLFANNYLEIHMPPPLKPLSQALWKFIKPARNDCPTPLPLPTPTYSYSCSSYVHTACGWRFVCINPFAQTWREKREKAAKRKRKNVLQRIWTVPRYLGHCLSLLAMSRTLNQT